MGKDLKFRSIKASDAGAYECEAVNGLDSPLVKRISIRVKSEFSITFPLKSLNLVDVSLEMRRFYCCAFFLFFVNPIFYREIVNEYSKQISES